MNDKRHEVISLRARTQTAILQSKGRRMIVGAALIWAVAVGFGVHRLLRYSNTPGRLAAAQADWPQGAGIHPEPGRATLIVFAHPLCGCSRATIGELAQVVARVGKKLDVFVFFYSPRSKGKDWARRELWRDAALIPGVKPMADIDGREAIRFSARTSGQTLLYDGGGRLVFNGGITAARGHLGPSDGGDAVVSLVENDTSQHRSAPAFGCSLLEEL